jgi:hypothetical protein
MKSLDFAPAGSAQQPQHPQQQQQRRSSASSSVELDEDELAAHQHRVHIENTAGYLRASRARSSELHGMVHLETVDPVRSSIEQQQQQPFPSGSSAGSSADAGVSLVDVEGGNSRKPAGNSSSTNNISSMLEPLAGESLTLGFERLSVWAPVNPKKPSVLERGWKKPSAAARKRPTHSDRSCLTSADR